MKILIAGLLAAGGAYAGARTFVCDGACPLERAAAFVAERASEGTAAAAPATAPGLTGRYVEARTASVFAGACHYNAEYTTAGRAAVCAALFDSGRAGGVELAGLGFVALVDSSANLASGEPRRSVVFVPRDLEPARRAALVSAVRAHGAERLGAIEEFVDAKLEIELEGDAYRVEVGEGRVRLEGAAMADRACCSMPLDVWYDPLLPIEGALVGASEVFAVGAATGRIAFERHGANDAFLGRFAWPSADPGAL